MKNTIKIPFVGGTYKSRSPNVDSQETTNLYFHHDEDKNRDALKSSPGLEIFAAVYNVTPTASSQTVTGTANASVYVTGGEPSYTWTVTSCFSFASASSLQELITTSNHVTLYNEVSCCSGGNATLTVTDSNGVSTTVTLTIGTLPTFTYDSASTGNTIATGSNTTVYVTNGVTPITWEVSSGTGATWHSNGLTSLTSSNRNEQLDMISAVGKTCGVDYDPVINLKMTEDCGTEVTAVLRVTADPGDDPHAPGWINQQAYQTGNYASCGQGGAISLGAVNYYITQDNEQWVVWNVNGNGGFNCPACSYSPWTWQATANPPPLSPNEIWWAGYRQTMINASKCYNGGGPTLLRYYYQKWECTP